MSGRATEPHSPDTQRPEEMLHGQEGDARSESESGVAVNAQWPKTHRSRRTMS